MLSHKPSYSLPYEVKYVLLVFHIKVITTHFTPYSLIYLCHLVTSFLSVPISSVICKMLHFSHTTKEWKNTIYLKNLAHFMVSHIQHIVNLFQTKF